MNIYRLSERDREALGIKSLPISLNEAVSLGKQSEFITGLLGERFKESYLAEKEKEYDAYRKTINQWEINNYLTQY